jgi:hypothetical protein
MIQISSDKIVIGCDYCGKVVYRANHVSSSIKSIADFYPTIQEAYKVHCEKCSMEPIQSMASISKTQELEDKIRELQKKLGIREKRAKKMIDKYKYDDIYL